MTSGGDGAGGGNGELGPTWCWSRSSLLSVGELVDLRTVPSVQAGLPSPPKADLWVSDELFHSTSTITFPLRHGKDAAGVAGEDKVGYRRLACPSHGGVRGLRVSLAGAAC